MDHLLAGPYFGRKWKIVLGAQCESGGFDEFPVAMNWLVLQLGGRRGRRQGRKGGALHPDKEDL
jgi:hypothetical protein